MAMWTSGPHVLALMAAALVCGVWGQGRQSCPSLTSTACYYNGTGLAAIPANAPSANKYFTIGGFFDVHEKGTNAYACSDRMSMEGILNLQAFLWGIREYSDPDLQNTGVSVGVLAFDSCMRTEQSIENMLSYAQCKLHVQNLPQTNLVAYVGAYNNEAAMALAPLATDLSVPLLSPVANSPQLASDENVFLLRLSPAFRHMVDSIHSLLQKLEVDRVIILYDSEDSQWTNAYNHLSHAIHLDSKCTHYESAYTGDNTQTVIDGLDENDDILYLVPLMSRDKLSDLMDAIHDSTALADNAFRFIISGIGRDMDFMVSKSSTANNSLIVEASFGDAQIQADFNEFIFQLDRSDNGQFGSADVAWISQYYQTVGKPRITDTTPSSVKFTVTKTLAAVKGIIQGMTSAVGDCNNQVCDRYRNQLNRGQNLWNLFSNALFNSENTNGTLPSSDIQYKVYHYHVKATQPIPTPVFEEAANIQMIGDRMETTLVKTSLLTNTFFTELGCPGIGQCCEPPTITTMAPTTPRNDSSIDATPDPAASRSKMAMVLYPWGQEITGAYSDTDRDDDDYGTRFDLNQRWIIALGVLAGLGILSVLVFEIYILYKLLGTRMGNKWRTMWLGQLLLFGVLLCYLVLFAYLPIPTKATCGITRFGVGVSLSICFAVLLVKLMVILTSRTSSDVLLPGDAESPNYLKGIYQFLLFIFAVGVQVVIAIQWLITVPPEAVQVISNNGNKVWVCNHYTWEAGKDMATMDGWVRSNFENHLMSLTYIMVMILITTILSLNAHGIITNHRESVFIGIAAGFSIPVWLAWGLVGGLNQDHDYAHEFGDACIAFGVFCTATLILFSMFLPKVRQLVNMGVEGIYLEDDRETYYAGSVIMAPPSYKGGKGPNSVIYVNNQGIYSEPVVIGNGDPMANRLKHPGSTYSAPAVFAKKADSTYGGSRVLRVTDDLKGRHPQKPRTGTQSEAGSRPGSRHGTLPRSRSQTSLGAL